MATAEEVVRGYLTALRDPDALKDEGAIEQKTNELQQTDDVIERLKLQDELRELRAPSLESAEDEFVVHVKAWAEENGVSADAFAAEGVSATVLRRAGFQVGRSRSKRASSRKSGRSRVTTEEVVAAIPSDTFTVKKLREKSGASPAVVRKAIAQEEDAGRVVALGSDPDHTGPGRAPTLYRRA